MDSAKPDAATDTATDAATDDNQPDKTEDSVTVRFTSTSPRRAILEDRLCRCMEYEYAHKMVNFCAVVGCGNRSDRDRLLSFTSSG